MFEHLISPLIKGISVVLLSIGSFFIPPTPIVTVPQTPTSNLASGIEAVADFRTSLANSITSSATTMTLVSTTTRDGTYLIQGAQYGFKLGGSEYVLGTLSSGKQIINMTRGISVVTATTSISSLQQAWGRGTAVELTDSPILLYHNNIVNGKQNLPNLITYENTVLVTGASPTTTVPTKYYVDNVATAGCADSSDIVRGCVETSTATEASIGATYGATGARVVLGANLATSSPTSVGNFVAITRSSDGKLSPNFIATSTSDAYRFAGPVTFNSSTTTLNATTSIAASTTTAPLYINTVPYAFASTQGASTTSLVNDGRGNLTWGTDIIASATADVTLSGSTATTTLFSATIPGRLMSTNGGVKIRTYIGNLTFGGVSGALTINLLYGTTMVATSSIDLTSSVPSGSLTGYIDATLINAGSTSSQEGSFTFSPSQLQTGAGTTPTFFNFGGAVGTSAIDSTADQTVTLVARWYQNSGSQVMTASHSIISTY